MNIFNLPVLVECGELCNFMLPLLWGVCVCVYHNMMQIVLFSSLNHAFLAYFNMKNKKNRKVCNFIYQYLFHQFSYLIFLDTFLHKCRGSTKNFSLVSSGSMLFSSGLPRAVRLESFWEEEIFLEKICLKPHLWSIRPDCSDGAGLPRKPVSHQEKNRCSSSW